MSTIDTRPSTKGLHQVADGVYAWLAHTGSFGFSNAGLVTGGGRSLLVDTLFDLPLTREMLEAMAPVTDASPITDAVISHANGDHCFGNQLLGGDVRIHAAPEVGHEMHEAPPAMIAAIPQMELPPVLAAYAQRLFGPFDMSGIQLRVPDTDIVGSTTFDLGGRTVRAEVLGPAHTQGDAVVHIPDAGVLFTGDLLFVDGTPIMWAGPVDSWLQALDTMMGWEPTVVVPGHGPVTDAEGMAAMRDYLAHVRDQAVAAHTAGKGWQEAAFEIDLGPYADWPDAERVAVTVHRIYSGLDPDTPEMEALALFATMAQWDATRGTGPGRTA